MIPPALTELFSTVTAGSWRAGWLILALIVVRRLVRGRIPAQVWFAVWIVVALRLLLPVSLPASWSPFNILPAHTAVSAPRLAPPAFTPTAAPAPAAIVATEPPATPPVALQDLAPPVTPVTASPVSAFPEPASVRDPTALPASLPEPAAAPSLSSNTTEIATALWLVGVAILALARLGALARFHRRLRTLRPTTDTRLTETVAREARQLGGAGAPICFETDAVDAPALFGILRPRLLFPLGLASQLTDDELRLVVRHELAHWRRRDLLAQTLLQAAAILHWFNPLAWCAARLARNDCELACDEFVLRRETAGGATAYGSTLLKVLGVTPRLRRPPTASVGIFESKQQLAQRVRTIAGYRAATRASLLGGIALVALVTTASLTRESRAAANEARPTEIATPASKPEPTSMAAAAPEILPDQVTEVTSNDLKRAGQELEILRARVYNVQERRGQGPLSELHFIAADPRIAAVREKVAVKKFEIEKIAGAYADAHPRRKAAENQLQPLEAELKNVAETIAAEVLKERDAKARAYAEMRKKWDQSRLAMAAAAPSPTPYAPLQPAVFAAQIAPSAPVSESRLPPAQERKERLEREQRAAMAQRILREKEEAFRARYQELMELRRGTDAVSARYSDLKRQERAKKPLADLPFIASQPLVARLNEELVTGRIEGATLRANRGETHPEVVAWTKRMAQISLELDRAVAIAVERIEADYRSFENKHSFAAEEADMARAQLAQADKEFGELRAEIEEAAQRNATPSQAVVSRSIGIESDPARPADFVIRIMGAVNQQGTMSFSAGEKPGLLDVIAQAGGFAPNADRSAVRLIWSGPDGRRESRTLSEDQLTGNYAAPAGSTIVVPEKERSIVREVSIIGAVNNPGTFALPEYDRVTLAALIAKAGGPSRLGDLRRVRVTRTAVLPNETQVLTLDLSALQGGESPAAKEGLRFEVKWGDVIFVPEKIL